MGLARVANELPMAASPACAQKSSLQKVRGPTEKCAIYVTQALTLLAERFGWILSRVLKKHHSVWDFATRDTATLLRAGVSVALFRCDYHATPARPEGWQKLHWGVNDLLLELACSLVVSANSSDVTYAGHHQCALCTRAAARRRNVIALAS